MPRSDIKLIRGDCMEYMAQMPDNAYDLAICDPPYFDGPGGPGYYGKGDSNLGVKRAKFYNKCDHWDIPDEHYFKELKRVSKNQIIWGANHFAGLFDSSSPSWIVWDKDNGQRSFADAEVAYTSFSTAVRIYKYMWNGMHQGSLGGNKKLNETRIHPTQKPVALYKWLLQNYAKGGDKILDTHLGSGSIAIACWDLKYDLTGYELDKDYYNASCKRFDNHCKQGQLF